MSLTQAERHTPHVRTLWLPPSKQEARAKAELDRGKPDAPNSPICAFLKVSELSVNIDRLEFVDLCNSRILWDISKFPELIYNGR